MGSKSVYLTPQNFVMCWRWTWHLAFERFGLFLVRSRRDQGESNPSLVFPFCNASLCPWAALTTLSLQPGFCLVTHCKIEPTSSTQLETSPWCACIRESINMPLHCLAQITPLPGRPPPSLCCVAWWVKCHFSSQASSDLPEQLHLLPRHTFPLTSLL